jgi:phytoene synthase
VTITGEHAADLAQARATLAAGSRSFALAGKLLPAAVRDDAAAIYAFCRRADDLVDEVPPAVAPVMVSRLLRELGAIYAGQPQGDPLLRAFQQVVRRRQLPAEYPRALIAGFAMDAVPGPVVYQSWQQLDLYCFRAAGTVGLMMAHLMGVRDRSTLQRAADLGMAMQLTNICRDVAEDWARGRLYVPRELLPPGSVLVPGGAMPAAARRVLSGALPRLLSMADRLYQRGDRGLDALDGRAAVAIRAARLIYSAIGDRLARQGHDVGAPRAVVGMSRKLWLALRALVGITGRRLLGRLGVRP